MAPYPWRNLLITGAASGLGRALAEACAAPGMTLHLGDVEPDGLAETAALCTGRGAHVMTAVVDVCDARAMAAWVTGAQPLDLVIANAGVLGEIGAPFECPDQARRIIETNVMGTINTALPAIAVMAAQAPGSDGVRGRIAVISSILAFVAAPMAPAYSASKSALQAWAEAMDGNERARGIRIHAVAPGYIRTGLSAANTMPMPLIMRPARAARLTLEGIAAGRTRISFPRRVHFGIRLVGALPPDLRNALIRRVQRWHLRRQRCTAG
ncbi:SDR family NAD(P)-dependent oxidoreductase [Sediminicoccus sp. BL-A-41-H5]|uniref:SDR family NAD(P)-dependent oxidoreductase n=1 Tax=Sediminicoccus sp. BL-A-41-H5 TaxID=3421106 RepID=UPI003D668ADE